MKEVFDCNGYEVLGLFSMRLSRAATCLKSESIRTDHNSRESDRPAHQGLVDWSGGA